jgi:6-pyruvoyltetrahydropterin/6-carboxytetrahydropterin synthase
MTYQVAVRRSFIAQHFLIGGDWGSENELHSHLYSVEAQLEGLHLDRNGYLIDIVTVETSLLGIVDYYRDRTLNDLPEFKELNPSIEHFSRIICETLLPQLAGSAVSALTVVVGENEDAWASYRMEV